jgi:hypothetical protein
MPSGRKEENKGDLEVYSFPDHQSIQGISLWVFFSIGIFLKSYGYLSFLSFILLKIISGIIFLMIMKVDRK